MDRERDNVVRTVADKGLCCGCGVCTLICPAEVLSMGLRRNGDLCVESSAKCVENCGLCIATCPFAEGQFNPRLLNQRLYGQSNHQKCRFDTNIGCYSSAAVGWRTNDELRLTSASGGLVTWVLERLLMDGYVDAVITVQFQPETHTSFFQFSEVSTVEGIRRCAGSVYCPVSLGEIERRLLKDSGKRFAVVGVSCLCAALRKTPRFQKTVPYVLGLACGMYQNIYYTELLLRSTGIRPTRVRSISYRRKGPGIYCRNYRFAATDEDKTGKPLGYRGLPNFLGRKGFFRLNACNHCKDVFAESADACFMDAWLPEYTGDTLGTSLVVVRNPEINILLQKGAEEKSIRLIPVSAEQVVESQRGTVNRKQKDSQSMTLISSLAAQVKLCVQRRSKEGWAKYGRRYGVWAFWLSMADVILADVVVSSVLPRLSPAWGYIRRFLRPGWRGTGKGSGFLNERW